VTFNASSLLDVDIDSLIKKDEKGAKVSSNGAEDDKKPIDKEDKDIVRNSNHTSEKKVDKARDPLAQSKEPTSVPGKKVDERSKRSSQPEPIAESKTVVKRGRGHKKQ